jgi:hypothetical protein
MTVEPVIRVAERQTRRYSTLGSGHTQVQVELERAQLTANLVLADIEPPLLGILNGNFIEGPAGHAYAVTRKAQGEGFRYVLEQKPAAAEPGMWTWRYSVAPGLHATYREAAFCCRDERGPLMVCDHVLRIPCELLDIHVELASRIDTAIQVVDDPAGTSIDVSEKWELRVSEDRRSVHLRVPQPVLGRRYGIRYWFAPEDESSVDVARTCEAILHACASDLASRGHGVATLRTELNRAINVALSRGTEEGEEHSVLGVGATWRVLLWEPTQRKLVTCIAGPQGGSASASYGLGEGVAGQCFRTWQPKGYSRSLADARRIYTADRHGSDDEWRFCIPLTLGAEQSPVGVVQFSGRGARGDAARILENLSKEFDVLSSDPPVLHGLVHHLFWMVNANFWKALADTDALESSMRQRAHGLALSYKNLGTAPARSTRVSRVNDIRPSLSAQADEPPLSVVRSSRRIDRTAPGVGTPSSKDELVPGGASSSAIRVAKIGAWATVAAAVIGAVALIATGWKPSPSATNTTVTANRPPSDRNDSRMHKLKSALGRATQTLRPQLAGDDLKRMILDDLHFRAANLRNAKLSDSSLVNCNLSYADLRGADLLHADLRGADLSGACYDHFTQFPDGFVPAEHGVVPAVHDVAIAFGKKSVTVTWEPVTEWMLVRWYDTKGRCISEDTCLPDSSEVQQTPVTVVLQKGLAKVSLFRRGAPFEEAFALVGDR